MHNHSQLFLTTLVSRNKCAIRSLLRVKYDTSVVSMDSHLNPHPNASSIPLVLWFFHILWASKLTPIFSPKILLDLHYEFWFWAKIPSRTMKFLEPNFMTQTKTHFVHLLLQQSSLIHFSSKRNATNLFTYIPNEK